MLTKSTRPSLRYIGRDWLGGAYVLRIRLTDRVQLAFGRFKEGKVIDVLPGEYTYVGSALAERGASCLANRLVRHATRIGDSPPHAIRETMLEDFPRVGLGHGDLCPKNGKHPRWNVDHLLDLPCADLTGAFLIRTPERIEAALGKFLENDPATIVFERGLGANDIKGNTHLLRVNAGDAWWNGLLVALQDEFAKTSSARNSQRHRSAD